MTIDNNSQKIFNNSLLYSIGMIASKAVGFFLVPIYTYNLSNADYGIATTITNFVSTFGILVMLSLRAALIRFYNDYSEEQKSRFVGSIVSVVLLSSTTICSLLCIFNSLYGPLLFKDIEFFPYVFCGVLSLGAEGIYLIYQSLLQAKQDGRGYSRNSIIYLLFHASTVVLFVSVFKWGLLGAILSNLATNISFAIYGLLNMRFRGYMRFSWEKPMIAKSLKYSLPILPHNLSTNLNTYSIKLIINRFLSYSLSGLYSLAAQFSTIIGLVQSSINLAFRPWFIEQMQKGEKGRVQIKQMSCMIMSLLSFCAVAISIFSQEIIMIMAEESYHSAWVMVSFFIIVQLISFIYFSHVQTLMYNIKASKFTMICSFSGLIVNVIISLLFVNLIGIYAVLVAQIVSQTVMASITVILSNKAERVDFGLSKMVEYIVKAIVLMIIGVSASLLVFNEINIISIFFKMILLLMAFIIFIFPYRREFKELLKGLAIKKQKRGD